MTGCRLEIYLSDEIENIPVEQREGIKEGGRPFPKVYSRESIVSCSVNIHPELLELQKFLL